MARTAGYRATKRNKDLLSQINKKIRSKQRRLKKVYDVDVPDVEVGIKHLKDFNSNKEIRDYLKQQESNEFLNRWNHKYVKNKHGVVFTYDEKKDFEKKTKLINKQNKEQLKKMDTPMKHNNKDLGYTARDQARMMGDSRTNMFREKSSKLDSFRSRGEFNKRKSNVDLRAKQDLLILNQRYRRNYIQGLETAFGGQGNYLIDYLLDMPLDQMVRISLSTVDADIEYLYSLEEINARLKVLEGIWGYNGSDKDDMVV